MDEEAAQRRAALAGRAHRREGDAAQREVEVGRGADDRGVVAAELQDGAGKARREPRPDLAAHGGRAGRRDDRHAGVVDEDLADLAPADQHLGQSLGRVAEARPRTPGQRDRKSTRLNSSHTVISYAVFCLKKKKKKKQASKKTKKKDPQHLLRT